MDKVIVDFIPTFYLKGVDYNKVYEKYINKEYDNIDISSLPSTKLVDLPDISNIKQYDNNINNDIFCINDSSGNKRTILTTNVKPVKYCAWCHNDINQPVGIPIRYSKGVIYIDQPCYCSFQCAYAGLKRDNPSIYYYRDPLYIDSEYLLHYLYQLMYPNQTLIPSPDWKLLDINGGPLSKDEFYNGKDTYISLPNVLISVVRRMYQVSNK
jgi:hypothetical protein